MAVGIGAGYLDSSPHFDFEIISDNFDVLGVGYGIGALVSFICLTGWSRHLERRLQLRMAAMVFAAPWLTLLVCYPIDGVNYHGGAALVLVLIVPASILSVILLIMSTIQKESPG